MLRVQCALCMQSSEHVVEGVVVKINKAGPRPEYEHTPKEEKAATQLASPSLRATLCYALYGTPLEMCFPGPALS
jgi:hypothetical protein